MTEAYESVWDAIEDSPADAAAMRLRSSLMRRLEEHIRRRGWTQAEAARRLGITQPRVSDLMRGKIERFSIDMLVTLLSVAGLRVTVTVAKARRELIASGAAATR